ncbi:hypothetical protein BDZ89DRAFT_1039325 [Hymenopellis radicata]|nr:hypothetical protein BDZ89DRAFT_1039325 [Hymenopellis radicata]
MSRNPYVSSLFLSRTPKDFDTETGCRLAARQVELVNLKVFRRDVIYDKLVAEGTEGLADIGENSLFQRHSCVKGSARQLKPLLTMGAQIGSHRRDESVWPVDLACKVLLCRRCSDAPPCSATSKKFHSVLLPCFTDITVKHTASSPHFLAHPEVGIMVAQRCARHSLERHYFDHKKVHKWLYAIDGFDDLPRHWRIVDENYHSIRYECNLGRTELHRGVENVDYCKVFRMPDEPLPESVKVVEVSDEAIRDASLVTSDSDDEEDSDTSIRIK